MKKYIILLLLALLPGISFARQAAGSIIYHTYKGQQTLAYRVLEDTNNVELLGFKEDPGVATDATVPEIIKDGQDEYKVVGIRSSSGSGWHNFQQATGRIRDLTIEAQLDYIYEMSFSNSDLRSVVFTKKGGGARWAASWVTRRRASAL